MVYYVCMAMPINRLTLKTWVCLGLIPIVPPLHNDGGPHGHSLTMTSSSPGGMSPIGNLTYSLFINLNDQYLFI